LSLSVVTHKKNEKYTYREKIYQNDYYKLTTTSKIKPYEIKHLKYKLYNIIKSY